MYMKSVQVKYSVHVKINATQEFGENLLLSVAFILRESVPFYPFFYKMH